MNTTLTVDDRHTHPPHSAEEQQNHVEQHPVASRHDGPLDRAALHLGVALIRWGRRPRVDFDREPARQERRATRLERALLRAQTESALERERERSRAVAVWGGRLP